LSAPAQPGGAWLLARVTLPFLAGYFASYVYRTVNAVVGPAIALDLGLSPAMLGLLSAMYFLSFALVQLPVGLLLDRFGPRRVNATLLLIAAIGGTWFASADSAASAIAARAMIGVGVSACLMSTFQAFVLWYPAERISTLNGVAFAAGVLGGITASVPLEMLVRVWHWREAFLLIAAFSVAASLVLWLWVPERSVRPHGETFAAQLRGLGELLRDPAFRRIALALTGNQFATVALQTLWVATWLRDVAGYTQAEVARGLFAVNVALIIGFMGFGRAADRLARRDASALPLLLGGVAIGSASLGLLALGVRAGSLALWCVFVSCSTAMVLGYSLLSRRYPKEMVGRANTAFNVFGFVGMFAGQWTFGLVLNLFPRTVGGYAAEGYTWALAMAWAVQFAGLVWLWSGRRLLGAKA
jgi:MFS family permease